MPKLTKESRSGFLKGLVTSRLFGGKLYYLVDYYAPTVSDLTITHAEDRYKKQGYKVKTQRTIQSINIYIR